MANDNVELGRFDLIGIPAASRGIPQIEVSFDIDKDGIVHVNAKDLGTGKEQSIRVTAPKKLSEEEIDKMVKEAEKYAEEDKKRKEEVEVRNQADTLAYSTEKSLKDFGEKISKSEKENIEKKLAELKEALKGKDINKIKTTMEELMKSSHKLAEEIYKQAQAKQKQGPQAGPQQKQEPKREEPKGKKGEDIVDADYTVENEDKNKDKK
jgi:molecular chaperone DnaK